MAVWTSAAHLGLSYLCGSFADSQGRGAAGIYFIRDMKILSTRKADWTAQITVTASWGTEYVFTIERDLTQPGFYFAALDGKELLPRLTYATEDGCVIRIYRFAKRHLN